MFSAHRNLKVTNNKTAGHTGKIQPTGHFTGGSRIGVEVIRVDAHGRDHDAEDVESPAERGQHVVVCALEGEAQQDEAAAQKRSGNPNGGQTGFRLKAAVITALVPFGDQVMEPVASYLA
ncbi:hypothetical protein J3458_004589 [Metarhizium acridum]|uniref:uncharacterized protein n=1 Tax=Metarhizium acridum TaxID=92637 RepID=UPI001C6CF386|nr:hypothetical protein J3458_004589 [Metarhizium acridum]